MNRIILIGNGFDLAHGLKTSYLDFMSDYWKGVAQKYLETERGLPYEDQFIKFENTNGPKGGYDAYAGAAYLNDPLCKAFMSFVEKVVNITSYQEIKRLIAEAKDTSGLIYELSFKNKFWEQICETSCLKAWVDIEREYYKALKAIHGGKGSLTVSALNDELEEVRCKLIEYLSKIQEEKITEEIINGQIKEKICEQFDPRDISIGGEDCFYQFIKNRHYDIVFNRNDIRGKYHNTPVSLSDIKYYLSGENMDAQKHEDNVRSPLVKSIVPPLFMLPENIMLVNFNYTKTAGLYLSDSNNTKLNHIHGELSNDANPVIFGYGDEMDEAYKKIVDLDDNDYLKNIKSIRYLETGNYRKLLSFIDSAPYQIYIMGHSCGNSDRTLLNTLFEHKNCVSIKPFFYQWEKNDGDGNTIKDDKGEDVLDDNYIDIVQNISRNFKDATLMRDRVVNKTICELHPQNPEHVQ